MKYLRRGDVVYNIDAHHDAYSYCPSRKEVNCANWADWAYNNGINIHSYAKPEVIKAAVAEFIPEEKVNLFVATSPNYANPRTDGHLMKILYKVGIPINFDLSS